MKFWMKSKTIMGIVISVLPAVMPVFGVGMEEGVLIGQQVDLIVQAVGVIIGIYGRAVAAEKLKPMPGK